MTDGSGGVAPSPTVDVLLPVRLPAPWLDETLDALREQTMREWHLVAVVHGDPGDLPRRFLETDPSAAILHVSASATLVDVLNRGLAECSAPFIARLDSDDIPEPERFERQADYLADHPDVSLVCSPVICIDEAGNPTVRGTELRASADVIKGLRWKNVVAHPTVMMRRSAIEVAGAYERTATHAEDYELWLRMAALGRLVRLPDPLVRYRLHSGQVTRTKAIPRSGRRAILEARLALARQRNESLLAARVRQGVWSVRQLVRSLQRSTS